MRVIVEQSEGAARSASDEDDMGAVIANRNGLVRPRFLVALPDRYGAVAAGSTERRRALRQRLQSTSTRGL